MNLFQSILDKAKSWVSSYNTMMEWVGSKVYDWANPNQDPIQRFLDDPNIEETKKQALFSDLQAWKPKEAISSYISEKYYPEAQFRETVPMAQPFFPATGKENAFLGSAKMIGNIPTSLYNLGAWAVNIGSTAIQEGVWSTASMLVKGIVKWVWQGAESVSQAYQEWGALWATSKIIEGTQKAIINDPSLLFGPQMTKGAWTLLKKWGKEIVRWAEKVAPKVVQGVKNMWESVWNVSNKIKSTYTDVASSLTEAERKWFQSNPYQEKDFADMVTRMKSPEWIDDIKNYQTEQYGRIQQKVTEELDNMQKNFSEDWKVYQDIKNLPTKVDWRPVLSAIESNPLIDIVDGKVVRKSWVESWTITDADIAHINRVYQDIVATINKNGGYLTVQQWLKIRSTLSKYARYDKMDVNTLSNDGANIMRDIRSSIDSHLKENVPWLRELDALYVDKMNQLNDALRDLIYKWWDVKWEYRSNLNSILSNLANPSRANLLARLEEVMPWIGKKVESIRNLKTLYKASQDKWVFNRFSWWVQWWVVWATVLWTAFPIVWHVFWFAWWSIIGRFIEWSVVRWKVKILEKILSKESPAKIAEIKRITDAIEKWKKLDAKWEAIINGIKKKVAEEHAKSIITPD